MSHNRCAAVCDIRCEAPVIRQLRCGARPPLVQGGLRPHAFCLPILKREEHRQAIAAAATSGNPRFFLGTDSAPHPQGAKVGSHQAPSARARPALVAPAFRNSARARDAFRVLSG